MTIPILSKKNNIWLRKKQVIAPIIKKTAK
jgi:hypothetical protein